MTSAATRKLIVIGVVGPRCTRSGTGTGLVASNSTITRSGMPRGPAAENMIVTIARSSLSRLQPVAPAAASATRRATAGRDVLLTIDRTHLRDVVAEQRHRAGPPPPIRTRCDSTGSVDVCILDIGAR